MAWTEEQLQAINQEGTNILVSAGAGSGKTAVLTERVKRKVLNGTSVENLLVLTFTNAAAAEMKTRIRKALKSTPGLEEEANLVDGAYITTFDSFALSIVKKYHTKLNIPEAVEITDEVILRLKKQEILDELMDCYYERPTEEFEKLIHDFCLKDDEELKKQILDVYSKIELKYDKTEFLNNYFDIYNEDKINSFIEEYLELLKQKQKEIKELFLELENHFDDDFIIKMNENYSSFLKANTYEEFLNSMNFGKINAPRGSSEEGKAIKSQISDLLKDFKESYLIYDSVEEIKEDIESTISSQEVIIEILKEFDSILDHYKNKNYIYNFNDIARLAIKVVEENSDVQEELREKFSEILVDEYQDTSDIQEKFISLIAKNNVYMVGDIKQSIYRFRNANPDIFQEKYNLYKDNINGTKIDLLKNFRSRREVLDDINLLFNPVMDLRIGGAEYPESHQMIFGNTSYEEEGKTDQEYHMNVLTYNSKELDRNITKAEEEAFIIANDIKDKISKHFQVFDKDQKTLRVAEYSDFTILLDRTKEFDTYKKIFEYLHIPLQILKDESFSRDDDSIIFKNLLKFIMLVKNDNINKEFEYNYISLARSFLYKYSDLDIYEIFSKKSYKDTSIYKDALELSDLIDKVNLSEFIRQVFIYTKYDEIILNTSDINAKRVREEYFYNLARSYEKLGNTIYDFVDYLDKVFDNDLDLTFNSSSKNSNSCRIMTIHKSKGLEFPICYFAGYTSTFNFSELHSRIIFDKEYGLILPKVNEYYKDTILKILLKNRVRLEEISEKIRLFYVATTRAKEEMIFVVPELVEEFYVKDKVSDVVRSKYNSFYNILKSITTILLPYTKESQVDATTKYKEAIEVSKYISNKTNINVNNLEIKLEEVKDAHFSKENNHIITKEEKEVMEFGTKVHEYLEELDFSNPVLLDKIYNTRIKDKITKFLNSDLMKSRLNYTMYKEYEFYYEEDNTINHGIIDLLIDNNDSYTIIDYKLKNIDDLAYNKQLNGYRNYIKSITGKSVDCYLYSILDETYREVKDE